MFSTFRRAAPALAGVFVVVLALSACGAGDAAGPLATRDLPGVGTVLVDKAGNTLYFTDSDKPGNIQCTGDCLDMWHPAEVAEGATVDGPVERVSTVRLPNGTNQLTYRDKPLYTFDLDSDSEPASGHNVIDVFDDVEFLWHAAVVDAADMQQPAPADDGYGY